MSDKRRSHHIGGWIAAVVIVLALVGGAVFGVRAMNNSEASAGDEGGGSAGGRGGQAVPVEAYTVSAMTIRETVRGIGTLRARSVVHVSPQVEGVLNSVHFEEGAFVEAGTVLAELDDRKLRQTLASRRAALVAARARADDARRTFDRLVDLRERNAATADEIDRARTELEATDADVTRLEADVERAEVEMSDMTLTAPFDGVIAQRLIDAGNYIRVGEQIATLYQVDPLDMSFRLPERFAGRVNVGQAVEVRVAAYPDERFAGVLQFVSPVVDESTRDFLVKAAIDNAARRLRPGMFGTAVLELDVREDRPVVPEEALVATRSGYLVFVIEDAKVTTQPVRIGLRHQGMVELLEGPPIGAQVVQSGQLRLSSGNAVSIVNEQGDDSASGGPSGGADVDAADDMGGGRS